MGEHTRSAGATVGAAAELIGVTVRTLHHWDAIGLASPSGRTASGYRLYTDADLERLERVSAYRQAGLGLDAIAEVLGGDATDGIVATLHAQRARLASRMRELERLDANLERMSLAHERGILLSDEEQRELFGDAWDPASAEGARTRWGGSAQWAQFAERSSRRGRAEWRGLAEGLAALQDALAEAMTRGVAPGDAEADELAERHRELFSELFPISVSMQVCLARMFESDPGFAAHYDGIRPGLASWFRRVIDEAARRRGIDPESATWR
ncbi:MerR family transcriptional regulator [Microbacterium sediminis]|uniref:MerR family transcriptional regulator n=1 Tax=Microbacterium sediminis TaxID=904291 RepID=UPI000B2354DA|nr:MerR family transcriptional regulator [Microbacterium sediminis]